MRTQCVPSLLVCAEHSHPGMSGLQTWQSLRQVNAHINPCNWDDAQGNSRTLRWRGGSSSMLVWWECQSWERTVDNMTFKRYFLLHWEKGPVLQTTLTEQPYFLIQLFFFGKKKMKKFLRFCCHGILQGAALLDEELGTRTPRSWESWIICKTLIIYT